jgi:surface protein
MPASDVTLYAQWSDGSNHNVIYEGNGSDGGEVPVDNNNYIEGQKVTVASAGTMTCTDCFFMGWNTEPDGSGIYYGAGVSFTMPREDVTLYAEWADVDAAFITLWDTIITSTGSSDYNQIHLPLESSGAYDFKISWGDGTTDYITSWDAPEATHTHAASGEYDLIISGTIKGFRFNKTGDRRKLLEISQWGGLNFGNNGSIFCGAWNLIITATDSPDLTGITDFSSMFSDCWALTTVPNMNLWDVSSVTDMSSMFLRAYDFNQDIGDWDVSNVIDMSEVFYYARSFNQNIGDWDVSKVTDMSSMFRRAEVFNQDIGDWDVSNVTDMNHMFEHITLSTSNYSAILIGWAGLPSLQGDVNFHGGDSKYNESAVAARQKLISTYGWIITDGGLE